MTKAMKTEIPKWVTDYNSGPSLKRFNELQKENNNLIKTIKELLELTEAVYLTGNQMDIIERAKKLIKQP